ncbi:hypothetical protein EWM64_g6876 [Hericium alpestre]|uniref:Uncharacterized protein n=1 Tax=Hericium alpestre TaxID=135208 RepID=A0A4Y9ZQF7_9AGAM|nr:hypothetical protein EWM64_g6876 [Hericium alpestre]
MTMILNDLREDTLSAFLIRTTPTIISSAPSHACQASKHLNWLTAFPRDPIVP